MADCRSKIENMQSKPEIYGIPDRKGAIKMYLGFCEKDSGANIRRLILVKNGKFEW